MSNEYRLGYPSNFSDTNGNKDWTTADYWACLMIKPIPEMMNLDCIGYAWPGGTFCFFLAFLYLRFLLQILFVFFVIYFYFLSFY